MDSKYTITGGQQGAVGDNAQAHGFTQQQIAPSIAEPLDFPLLAAELARLAEAARNQAVEPEHQLAIGSIEAAKAAAEKGEESKALAFLKSTGQWAFDIATKIGTTVAAEAIKRQM